MTIKIRWQCQNCKNEGTSDEGYYIRCSQCGCGAHCFKVLEIYASIKLKEEIRGGQKRRVKSSA